MRSIAVIDAEITTTQGAIDKTLHAQSYGQGDRQVSRVELEKLRKHLGALQLERNQVQAANLGARNPGYGVVKWG